MIWIDFENKYPTDTNIPGWVPWSKLAWDKWQAKSKRLVWALSVLNRRGDIKKRNALIDKYSSHWGALKDWLLALSNGKCWFSEAKDIYSHYDVEHFRPKKEAKNAVDDERDGYWWLAFDYMNFRACGNVGNRKKGGWFPLQAGSQISSHDNRREEMEVCYLLDPVDIDDVKLIAFNEEGSVIPAPGATEWEKMRVTETVKRLKLNEHVALSEARRDLWAEVTLLINDYLTAKSRCTTGENVAAKEKVKIALKQVRKLTRPTSELSSVAKWCVLLRKDTQLSHATV